MKSKLDQTVVAAVWLTLGKHMLVGLLVTPTYLSSEPEHASKSYLFADIIYILILVPNQNTECWGMYLTSVDLSAVCLRMMMCFIQVIVYLGMLHDLATMQGVGACSCGHGFHFATIQSLSQMQCHVGALCSSSLARFLRGL